VGQSFLQDPEIDDESEHIQDQFRRCLNSNEYGTKCTAAYGRNGSRIIKCCVFGILKQWFLSLKTINEQ